MDDSKLTKFLYKQGYLHVRRIPGGPVIGVTQMMYTFALVVGLDKHGYASRYCYETLTDANYAYIHWSGNGDPPGPWIKHEGAKVERLGPGATGAKYGNHAA